MPINIWRVAPAYALKGNYKKAFALLEEIKNSPGMKDFWAFLYYHALVLAASGRREEALKKLEELEAVLAKNSINPFYETACIYAALGDKDKAFGYLYQAYENHSTQMVFLIRDWWLRSLHGDPRFEDLRKKVGFPDVPKKEKR